MGRPRLPLVEVICANPLCQKKLYRKRCTLKRSSNYYCNTACRNTIHGNSRSLRYEMWCRVKKNSKPRGLEFTLFQDDIPVVPTVCPILGIAIKPNHLSGAIDSSPSLDRIDNSKGYIPGNVRIISNRANRLRSDATSVELDLIAADNERLESLSQN